jgi:hypothetical protein
MMASERLGRTNQAFPKVWLRLVGSSEFGNRNPEVAQSSPSSLGTVIDISTNPALWGGQMRGTEGLLMSRGGLEIERAPDEKTACDLIQAHLIQTLSAIGREWIDFYFLQVRRGLEEYQIAGALQALESARQEGHIKFLGLSAEGPGLAVQGVWQFHDAFEVLLLSEPDQGLLQLAQERRVGLVTAYPSEHTCLQNFQLELAGARP